MTDDKIAEIRERHAQSDNNFIEYESTWDIHADRATLLAEVEKQRAENERLREALKPFAVEAEAYDPPEEDDAETAWFSLFTCGNLRDARNALEGKP